MTKTTETINGTLFYVTRPADGKLLQKPDGSTYEEAYDLKPFEGYVEVDRPTETFNEEKQ